MSTERAPPLWGGVGHVGVGWVMQGWSESYRDRLSHAVVGWVMQGCSGSYRGRVGCVKFH